MSNANTETSFDLRRVAKAAVVGAVLAAAGATLWQFPGVKEFATTDRAKQMLLDVVTKLVNGELLDTPISRDFPLA